MRSLLRAILVVAVLAPPVFVLGAAPAEAQQRGRGRGGDEEQGTGFVEEVAKAIREFYVEHPRGDVEALPPGIRRNLARGKPLPPGIAKRSPPPELEAILELPDEVDIVEVGLDVFLVEVATGLIRDVLEDVVR